MSQKLECVAPEAGPPKTSRSPSCLSNQSFWGNLGVVFREDTRGGEELGRERLRPPAGRAPSWKLIPGHVKTEMTDGGVGFSLDTGTTLETLSQKH